MLKEILIVIFGAINLTGYIYMMVDKLRAKRKQWRIPERQLWIIAMLGGAIGLTIGMYMFRHKTKHLKFKVGFFLLAAIQFIMILYFIL